MLETLKFFFFASLQWDFRCLSKLHFYFQERVSDPAAKSSHFAARPSVPPYAPPMITMDNDDGIPYSG